jgi:hypothetical protein
MVRGRSSSCEADESEESTIPRHSRTLRLEPKLLQETVIDVIIAGRNLELAQQEVDKLNKSFSGERARARKVDASSTTSLEDAFQDIDMVVVRRLRVNLPTKSLTQRSTQTLITLTFKSAILLLQKHLNR